MKFGKTLRRLLYSEWSQHYIDYKLLKQYIQTEGNNAEQKQQFIDAVYSEINKINTFYCNLLQSKHTEFTQCAQHIRQCIDNKTPVDDATMQQLSQYIYTYDRLRSFMSLNQLGFTKVLKKYDKHNTNQPLKPQLMQVLIQQDFYSSNVLADNIVQCNIVTALLSTQYSNKLLQHNISPVTSIDYQCAICMNLLFEPVVLTCAHTFCQRCIVKTHQQTSQHAPCCPTCRRPVYVNATTYAVHELLAAFIAQHYTNEYNSMVSERMQIPKTPSMTSVQQQAGRHTAEGTPIPSPTKYITRALNDTHMSTGDDALDDLVLPPANPTIASPIDHTAKIDALHVRHDDTQLIADTNGIYVSHNIDTLLKYKHLGKKLYCIVDIDETIHINPHKRYGCMLMNERGLQSYQHVLANSAIYANVPIPAKNKTTRVLQAALASKQCVEIDSINNGKHLSTIDTIHQLQEAGCYVFALTARYATQAETTRNELLTLDIDFAKSTPWPAQCELHDTETDAAYSNGVIYTSATEKGVILDRFLNGLFVTDNNSVLSGLQVQSTVPMPTHCIFIDDRYSNCHSVQHSCQIVKLHNIELMTIHYTYCASDDDTQSEEKFDIEVVQCQIHHFLHTNQILNDLQAAELLKQYKTKHASLNGDEGVSSVRRSPTRTILAAY